jgi:hypothetical protein
MVQGLSIQGNFNADTARAMTPAIILTADTFIIQPFYFFRIRNSQDGPVIINFKDVPAIQSAGLHTCKPTRRTRALFLYRHTLTMVNGYLGFSRFKLESLLRHGILTPHVSLILTKFSNYQTHFSEMQYSGHRFQVSGFSSGDLHS